MGPRRRRPHSPVPARSLAGLRGRLRRCRFRLSRPRLLFLVLPPDAFEFELHHARRDGEIVILRQLVEQRALQAQTRCALVVALHLLPHFLAQLGKVPEPDGLTELVVDDQRQALAHLLHIDLEHRLLTGEIRDSVIFRERDADSSVLAGAGADQLLLEAGDEAGGTKHDLTVFPAGSWNLLLAAAPLDIDHDDVAALGRALGDLGLTLLFGDSLDRTVDILIGHLDDEPLDVEVGKARFRDIRQHLQGHLVFEIGPLAERDDVDLWRQCRTQIALAYRVGGSVLQSALQHLTAHRITKALAQDLHRDLARTEPAQLDRPADIAEPAGDLFLELAGRDNDAELALETFGVGFCHLHEGGPVLPKQLKRWWCGRGDLNPHDFHRWNLNPVRLPIPPRPPLPLPERLSDPSATSS